MIKKILFLFAFCLILLCIFSCTSKEVSHLEEMNLKGDVKFIKEVTYKSTDGEILSIFLTQFNSNGYKTNEVLKSPDGSSQTRITYYYNKRNYNTKQFFYDENDTLLIKIIYGFNSIGRPSSFIVYDDDDKIRNKGEFTYDNDGNLLKFYNFDTLGKIIMEESYIYDSLGFLTSKDSYEHSKFLKYEYKRDSLGNPVLINVFNKKEVCVEKKHYIYIYDESGNWTERTEIIDDSVYERKTREIAYY